MRYAENLRLLNRRLDLERDDMYEKSYGELKESELTYDQKFKQLFQNKKFLVPILKNIVKEYKDLPLSEIESLIVSVKGDEEVAAVLGVEDVGKGQEMKTFYDVLVGCRLPDSQEVIMVDLYFDLEMQREKNTRYPVSKRGIYYCSRMISRQLTNVEDADYSALKPVYSVWIILNNIPQALRYSRYEVVLKGTSSLEQESQNFNHVQKAGFERAVKKLDSQIDLIHLCLIFLAEDFSDLGEAGDALIRYMQSVFIKKVANPDYNPYAEYSKSVQKEAEEVMTIAAMFEARGEVRGEERGEIRGEARGIIKMGRRHCLSDAVILEDLVSQTGCSMQEAEKFLRDFDR